MEIGFECEHIRNFTGSTCGLVKLYNSFEMNELKNENLQEYLFAYLGSLPFPEILHGKHETIGY